MKLPLENIQSLIRCPVCNKKYRSVKMLVIDESDKRTTLHMTCDGCSATTIVYVSLGHFGVVTLATLTDLEQSEARHVFLGETVSTNNVIEVHQFLKNAHASVEELIA